MWFKQLTHQTLELVVFKFAAISLTWGKPGSKLRVVVKKSVRSVSTRTFDEIVFIVHKSTNCHVLSEKKEREASSLGQVRVTLNRTYSKFKA